MFGSIKKKISAFSIVFLAIFSTIQCAATVPAYTLGGVITGLTGTIVLDNNGSQTLTASSNGDFTFLGSKLEGTSYNVTISVQPMGQTCRVTGGLGKFTDQVKNVIVACEVPIKIASWNVENFGPSKAAIATVMSQLTQVMMNFDVIFIQEMPTATTTQPCANYSNQVPANCLLTRLNDVDRAGAGAYTLLLSPTSGTGGNMEKYACYYRTSKFTVLQSFLANAAVPAITPALTFVRPPFIVRLKTGNTDFYVVSIHTTPDNVLTRSEINQLPKIADYLQPTDPDIIILGDFNSGSTYFTTPGDWTAYFANFSTSGYTNFITDTMDTTVTTTNTHTYDRITLSPSLAPKVKSGSAGPYYFDGQGVGATCTSGDTAATMNAIITAGCSMGILFGHASNPCTCNGAASEVSDHYPVGLTLNF